MNKEFSNQIKPFSPCVDVILYSISKGNVHELVRKNLIKHRSKNNEEVYCVTV